MLSIIDVLNAVVCCENEDAISSVSAFQRFGVTRDGIDLSYDATRDWCLAQWLILRSLLGRAPGSGT